jgi:hypothetical protein
MTHVYYFFKLKKKKKNTPVRVYGLSWTSFLSIHLCILKLFEYKIKYLIILYEGGVL